MGRSPAWLLDHRHDVHSQCGEDGIIAKILEIIPDNDRWCVEFGAWDGRHLSNTCQLIENGGYSAVLIEGDAQRSAQLAARHAANDHIHTINRYVGCGPTDNLDTLLSETPVPIDFDLLSIDIDGQDYHAWKHTTRYQPKVVCIEFNPTIPTEVEFVPPADPDVYQSCSLKSLVELGRTLGYELVCVTNCNALFVKDRYFPLFEIEDNSPHVLRTDFRDVTWIFTGQDGHVFLRGACRLPWHNVDFDEARIQPIPLLFRRFPGQLGRPSRMLFKAWKKLRKPLTRKRAA